MTVQHPEAWALGVVIWSLSLIVISFCVGHAVGYRVGRDEWRYWRRG